MEAVQCRAFCEADGGDSGPRHVCAFQEAVAFCTASSISCQFSKRRPLRATDLSIFHQGSITHGMLNEVTCGCEANWSLAPRKLRTLLFRNSGWSLERNRWRREPHHKVQGLTAGRSPTVPQKHGHLLPLSSQQSARPHRKDLGRNASPLAGDVDRCRWVFRRRMVSLSGCQVSQRPQPEKGTRRFLSPGARPSPQESSLISMEAASRKPHPERWANRAGSPWSVRVT